MELLCSDHLTDDEPQEVPAVTMFNGSALCEPCAMRRSELLTIAANRSVGMPMDRR